LRSYILVIAILLLGGLLALLVAVMSEDTDRTVPEYSPAVEPRGDPGIADGVQQRGRRPTLGLASRSGERDRLSEEGPLPDGAHELRVYGSVTNERGEFLSGVRVLLDPPWTREVSTDLDGNYALYVVIGPEEFSALRFLAEGHEEGEFRLSTEDVEGAEEMRIDVRLEALGERAVVSGTLSTKEGEPISGERIYLRSRYLKTRYAGVTDEHGGFLVSDVKPGSDYELIVRPERFYQDYREGYLAPTADGLSLEVVLEPLTWGRLSGRMVDAEGNPIPRLSLSIRSAHATKRTVTAKSDEAGYFNVEEVPSGPLSISNAILLVRGVSLPPDSERVVVLVLDWGNHVVNGRILDPRGGPVAAATVDLSWVHRRGRFRSGSARRALFSSPIWDPDSTRSWYARSATTLHRPPTRFFSMPGSWKSALNEPRSKGYLATAGTAPAARACVGDSPQ
jgi:hypothetical protein